MFLTAILPVNSKGKEKHNSDGFVFLSGYILNCILQNVM